MALRIHKSGFTLIELMVVVIIMMALLGLTLVNYSSFNDSQKVKQTAMTLKSDLQMARASATSGKKPAACDGELFEGYEVSFTATTYSIAPKCSTVGVISAEKIDVTLPSGISFSPTPSTFLYYPLIRGMSATTPSVTVTDGENTATVNLYE